MRSGTDAYVRNMSYRYVIFEQEKKPVLPVVHDVVHLFGRTYEAEIVLQEIPGYERVYSLHLSEDGETLGYYEDGRWVIDIDPMDSEPEIAVAYFLNSYNKRLKLKEL